MMRTLFYSFLTSINLENVSDFMNVLSFCFFVVYNVMEH